MARANVPILGIPGNTAWLEQMFLHRAPLVAPLDLKEYYEIVDEARPLIRIFPPHILILLQKYISNHKTKQAFKFQSDPSSNCFTINVWKIKCQHFISYFLIVFICISFYKSSVVFWHVIFWEQVCYRYNMYLRQ